jgi:hypothetical protein
MSKIRDLTKAEFDSIITGKPSYEQLFKVFSKMRNFMNVRMNKEKVIPVW